MEEKGRNYGEKSSDAGLNTFIQSPTFSIKGKGAVKVLISSSWRVSFVTQSP